MALDFNWTTVAVVLLNVLVGGVLVALIRRKPALDRLANEREANLLSERAKEMQEMRERIRKLEDVQEAKDRFNDAKEALARHRINNLNSAFQALLLLLKKGVPVEEAVAEIEELRSRDAEREAREAATIRAAAIKAGLAIEGDQDL
jgi:hypothetical protein